MGGSIPPSVNMKEWPDLFDDTHPTAAVVRPTEHTMDIGDLFCRLCNHSVFVDPDRRSRGAGATARELYLGDEVRIDQEFDDVARSRGSPGGVASVLSQRENPSHIDPPDRGP